MAQSNRDVCKAKMSQINGHLKAIQNALQEIASRQNEETGLEIITYCFLINETVTELKDNVLPQLDELI